jgi:hypothetical protein
MSLSSSDILPGMFIYLSVTLSAKPVNCSPALSRESNYGLESCPELCLEYEFDMFHLYLYQLWRRCTGIVHLGLGIWCKGCTFHLLDEGILYKDAPGTELPQYADYWFTKNSVVKYKSCSRAMILQDKLLLSTSWFGLEVQFAIKLMI